MEIVFLRLVILDGYTRVNIEGKLVVRGRSVV